MSMFDDMSSLLAAPMLNLVHGEPVTYTPFGGSATPISAVITRGSLITQVTDKGQTLTWDMSAKTAITDTPVANLPNKSATFLVPRRLGETPQLYSASIINQHGGEILWGLRPMGAANV